MSQDCGMDARADLDASNTGAHMPLCARTMTSYEICDASISARTDSKAYVFTATKTKSKCVMGRSIAASRVVGRSS